MVTALPCPVRFSRRHFRDCNKNGDHEESQRTKYKYQRIGKGGQPSFRLGGLLIHDVTVPIARVLICAPCDPSADGRRPSNTNPADKLGRRIVFSKPPMDSEAKALY